jgi:hypothetical protein
MQKEPGKNRRLSDLLLLFFPNFGELWFMNPNISGFISLILENRSYEP